MKQNFFILSAYPGHGKDFSLFLLNELTKEDFCQIQLALKAKEIISNSLHKRYLLGNEENKVEVLNYLKDKKMDEKILGNKNMRGVLQIILGDVFRTINPNINILFTLKTMENKLLENVTSFVCTDNRYKNEQEFLYPLTKLNTNDEKIDYIRWQIRNNLTKYTKVEILEIFDHLTKDIRITNEDIIMLNKIKIGFLEFNDKLNETEVEKNNYIDLIKKIDFNNIGKMTKEEGLKNGLINIFRPIIPINYQNEKSNILEVIEEYTRLQKEEIIFIKDNYKRYNIDFNIANIHKYGFLRADPNHLSETDLNGRKPEPFLNIPFHLEGNLRDQLSNLLVQKKNYRIKKIKHT